MKYGKPGRITPLVLRINPNAKVGMEYTWVVENKVQIDLSYNNIEEGYNKEERILGINSMLIYTYLPIWREINELKDKDVLKTKDKL
jgi:hypothetical protein